MAWSFLNGKANSLAQVFMLQRIRIKEHDGYYFSYDTEDPSVPVTVHSNWKKTGQTPAVIDTSYSKPLKTADDRDRLYVFIATMGKKVRLYLDTLVASYLIDNPRGYEKVVHKDGNIYNCHPTNLKWISAAEYKNYYRSINVAKGKDKQFKVTYKDGTTEVITGFLDFIAKRGVPEHVLYSLRKGDIKEYNGIVGFEEIATESRYRDGKKKPPAKFDLTGYEVVELDAWPGYYVVYKKDDQTIPVRILSKWKKVGDQLLISEDFTRETSQHVHKTGYVQVNVKRQGESKIVKKLHRLIAEQLIPNPYDYDTVDHKDWDKLNNHPANLQWMSISDNSKKGGPVGTSNAKHYEITYVDGRKEVIFNLKQFCISNGYSPSSLDFVMNGRQAQHKDIIGVRKVEAS